MTRHESRRPEPAAEPRSHAELDQEAEEVTLSVMAASRLLVAISARALASIDETLTLPQLRALVVLHAHGPVKLAAMASTLGVNPSTALRMVERLESAATRTARPIPTTGARSSSLSRTAGGSWWSASSRTGAPRSAPWCNDCPMQRAQRWFPP